MIVHLHRALMVVLALTWPMNSSVSVLTDLVDTFAKKIWMIVLQVLVKMEPHAMIMSTLTRKF